MKKMAVCIAVSLVSLAAFAQKDCRVKGMADATRAGEWVYAAYGAQYADSSKVKADGSFSFDLKADGKVYSCFFAGSRSSMSFVSERGEVDLDLEKETLGGGKHNSALSKFEKENRKIVDNYEQEARKIAETISDRSKQAEAIDKVSTDAIAKLIKNAKRAIADNATGEIGGYALALVASYLENDEFFSLYESLSEDARQYPALQTVYTLASALKNTAEGEMFTDFVIPNGSLEGKSVRLSDYVGKGKYTLVDFWATWCGPCKREIPNLREIHKDFGDRITVLSVAVWDKREATEKFVRENDMPWNHIVDAQQVPTDLYGIQGIPQIILFAPDGTIVKRDLRGGQIRKTLEKVLGK